MKHLLILVAMQAEAQGVIQHFNLVHLGSLGSNLPMQVYAGTIQASNQVYQLTLVTSGQDLRYQVDNIGTEAATLSAFAAIQQFKPDLVLNIGTAGGFADQGASIGTVYLSTNHFIYHGRYVPLAGFCDSVQGNYPALNTDKLAHHLALPQGVISTGNSFKRDESEVTQMKNNQVVAKEMEAAAIAWVCGLSQIPFIAMKSITNLLDHELSSEHQFEKNLYFACRALWNNCIQLIDVFTTPSLTDLFD